MLRTTTHNGLTINCQVKLTMKDSNDRRSKDTSLIDRSGHKSTLTLSTPILLTIAPIGLKLTIAPIGLKLMLARSDPIFRTIAPIGPNMMTNLCDLNAKAISLRSLTLINGQCDPSMRGTNLASISDPNALRERCMSLESILDLTVLKGRPMSLESIADQSASSVSTKGPSSILGHCANPRIMLNLEHYVVLSNILILACASNIVLSDLN